jgi:hypothetical protein
VSLTRARDRLYLSGTLGADGRFNAGKGGLGRTLPPTVSQLFTLAGSGEERRVTWIGPTASHVFRVLHAPESPTMREVPAAPEDVHDDFTPLQADGMQRIAATASDFLPQHDAWQPKGVDQPSIEAGVLVHRALEAGTDDFGSLLRDDERALVDDVGALFASAGEALSSIRTHPAVVEIFTDQASIVWRRHEVPFSWRSPDGSMVRGTFDCLLERTSGAIEVLEFKTGRPAPEHQRQLEAYLAAAQALFPDRSVEGRLIYARPSETTFDDQRRLRY